MEDNKVKHLEMVQNIINRISSHDPNYKGWFISIIVAINILNGNKVNFNQLFIMFIVTIAFWIVSSLYLNIERRYIELYKDIRLGNIDDFDMNIKRYKKKVPIYKSFISISHTLYYFAFILIILFTIILPFNQKYYPILVEFIRHLFHVCK